MLANMQSCNFCIAFFYFENEWERGEEEEKKEKNIYILGKTDKRVLEI